MELTEAPSESEGGIDTSLHDMVEERYFCLVNGIERLKDFSGWGRNSRSAELKSGEDFRVVLHIIEGVCFTKHRDGGEWTGGRSGSAVK